MKNSLVTVKNEPLSKTTQSKKKMDTGTDDCRYMQRRCGRRQSYRALALRHMELPVGDFITDALSTEVPENAREISTLTFKDEENHDVALGYIANAYGVDEQAEAEALTA